jgi:hypothetical protein
MVRAPRPAPASPSRVPSNPFTPKRAVHCDHLEPVAPGLRLGGEPGLEDLLGAALDHVEQPGRAAAVTDRGEVHDHRHEPVRQEAGMSPVGSGCGALSRLPVVGFHSPPAEPGVRLSPHRALHVRVVGQLVRAVGLGVHGVGIW